MASSSGFVSVYMLPVKTGGCVACFFFHRRKTRNIQTATKAVNANAPTTVPAIAPLENVGAAGEGGANAVLLAAVMLEQEAGAEFDALASLSDAITSEDGVGVGLS